MQRAMLDFARPALAFVAALFALGCGEPALEAAKSVKAAIAAVPAMRGGEAAAAAEAPAASTGRTYYQYLDASGSVRFVSSLDEVPPEWRERAGRVEMAGPPPTSPSDRMADLDRRRERARATLAAAPRGGAARGPRDDVVLYYAEWCGYCRKAKAHLDAKGVDYELRDVDVASVKSELVAKTGSGSIPVLEVGGEFVRGFNPDAIDRLVASR